MPEISSNADLRSFILSSRDHMKHLIDGQVLNASKVQLDQDIQEDEKIIASFLEDGGRVKEADDEHDYTEISFGSSFWRQYTSGEVFMSLSALDHNEAERLDETICALLDMHAAKVARDGGILKLCRNMVNYDYIVGMDELTTKIKDHDVTLAASMISDITPRQNNNALKQMVEEYQ